MGTGDANNCKIGQICFLPLPGATLYTDQGKSWCGIVHYKSTLLCQTWPDRARGKLQKPPNFRILLKLFLAVFRPA